MVSFMLHATRHQSGDHHAYRITVDILAADGHGFKTRRGSGNIWDRETPFDSCLGFLPEFLPHRVDNRPAHAGFSMGAVVDEDAL